LPLRYTGFVALWMLLWFRRGRSLEALVALVRWILAVTVIELPCGFKADGAVHCRGA
jgi:hypothetical protein